ncbi:MAG: hypothetical protein AAGF88_07600 [Pseudomonadota bacterium]
MKLGIFFTAALFFATSMAHAATFSVDFSVNGTMGVVGTFEAPATGGVVSNFSVTLSGVTFDTQVGGGAFEYNPTVNDFENYSAFPSYSNSVATGLCAIGACFLEIYPIGDGTPGDYLAIDAALANIDDGTKYLIGPSAIPLPASAALLLAALGSVAFTRRKSAAM